MKKETIKNNKGSKKFFSQQGFSFSGLTVIVLIVGVIALVIFWGIGDSKKRAFDSKAKDDLEKAAWAMQLYYDEYGIFWDTEAASPGTPMGPGKSIGRYLIEAPYHNGDPVDGLYFWYNPDNETQHFCFYVRSAAKPGVFFYASDEGQGETDSPGCP